jgi:phasin family protein
MGEKAAEATRDAARANGEILQRNVETAQEAMRAGLATGAQSIDALSQMMSRAFGMNGANTEIAEQSERHVRAVSDASAALARGAQEAARLWFDLLQCGVRDNLEATTQLVACRSPQDLVALQSRLTRDNLQRFIDSGRQIAQCSTDAINNANSAMHSA